MDNQHKKITGYRDLSQAEIDLMNEIKAKANEVGELIKKLENAANLEAFNLPTHDIGADVMGNRMHSVRDAKRWTSIAKTHLQQGFMALTRAVARPESF